MSPKHMTGDTRRHFNPLKELKIISNKLPMWQKGRYYI